MATEVWFRNPYNYISELMEIHHPLVTWDRGILIKKRIDPTKFMELHAPQTLDYRALAIGIQGAAEIRRGYSMEKPYAVYPVWSYGDPLSELLDMMENNIGLDEATCRDLRIDPDQRPTLGQEHRVVIVSLPHSSSPPGKSILRMLHQHQMDFPEAIIHIHGLYGFRPLFGFGWGAVDYDPRTLASKGKVALPMGKEMLFERAQTFPKWLGVVGARPSELIEPRNRCIFNMKSALWAASNFMENSKFKVTRGEVTTPEMYTDPNPKPAEGVGVFLSRARPQVADGDMFVCNSCSVQNTCKYFRVGAVCSVPGSEPAPLSKFFKTRDSDSIIDGLGTVLAAQANRAQMGMESETEFQELDPEVTKILKAIMDGGVKLAKLVNPRLAAAGAPKFNFNQLNLPGGPTPANATTLTSAVVAELEARGIKREDITPEMVTSLLSDSEDLRQKAIEATAT